MLLHFNDSVLIMKNFNTNYIKAQIEIQHRKNSLEISIIILRSIINNVLKLTHKSLNNIFYLLSSGIYENI